MKTYLSASPVSYVLLLSLVASCDGVGRPLVGPINDGDGGEPQSCEIGPTCRPLRTVDDAHFDVPTQAASVLEGDCDGDLVDDAVDNCLGVPNPTQGPTDCEQATSDCRRLVAGEVSLDGADLRGCRLESPILVNRPLSLRGASVLCAHIELSGTADTTVDLSSASLTSSRLFVRGESPLAIDLGRTTVFRSSITIAGAARVHAEGAIFEEATLFLHPSGGAVDGLPAPAFDVSGSNFSRTTFWESPSSRSGRVRIDRSAITNSGFDVRELDLYGTTITASQIASEEFDAFEIDLSASEVRTNRGAIASSRLVNIIFDRCESLRISSSDLSGVDMPACPPLGLRVFRSELDGCNFAGGVELEESHYFAGVLGGGPTTTLTALDSDLDGVRFCDLGAAVFIGGDIRCVHCAEDAFSGGDSVCLSGTSLFERGCQAIEFAPSCE